MTRLLAVPLSLVVLALVPSASGSQATSPGADGLLLFQSNRDGNFDLYVAAADGSNPRTFLARPDTNEFNPAWSPNGQRIVFQTGPPDGSDFDIWLANADGSGATPLVTGSTSDRAPQFCDADTVVFTSQLTVTNSEIFTIETSGSGIRRLTDDPGIDSSPTCSPSETGSPSLRTAQAASRGSSTWVSTGAFDL